ncbi:hypothetical protein LX36DRAFT_262478 [Colletotrichum falcatum]|nr:hypothetical protein LX36DRAFT_262478 [Colletotrichum falcatum]
MYARITGWLLELGSMDATLVYAVPSLVNLFSYRYSIYSPQRLQLLHNERQPPDPICSAFLTSHLSPSGVEGSRHTKVFIGDGAGQGKDIMRSDAHRYKPDQLCYEVVSPFLKQSFFYAVERHRGKWGVILRTMIG